MATENDILNLIADLKANNDEREQLEDSIAKAKIQLENDEDELVDLKANIERDRDTLDELIDEVTNRKDDNLGFGRSDDYPY